MEKQAHETKNGRLIFFSLLIPPHHCGCDRDGCFCRRDDKRIPKREGCGGLRPGALRFPGSGSDLREF